MSFLDTPILSSSTIIRKAGATAYSGRKVKNQLVKEGRIHPVVTTTREELTPRDGQVLYEALTQRR